MAVLEGNRFIGHTWEGGNRTLKLAATDSLPPYEARAANGHIFQSFSPDQAIVPVTVSEILIFLPRLVVFREIVTLMFASRRRICRKKDGPTGQLKPNVTHEVNGIA